MRCLKPIWKCFPEMCDNPRRAWKESAAGSNSMVTIYRSADWCYSKKSGTHPFSLFTGDQIKWDLRYTQKPIYFHVFTNKIRSYLLWPPVIAHFALRGVASKNGLGCILCSKREALKNPMWRSVHIARPKRLIVENLSKAAHG